MKKIVKSNIKMRIIILLTVAALMLSACQSAHQVEQNQGQALNQAERSQDKSVNLEEQAKDQGAEQEEKERAVYKSISAEEAKKMMDEQEVIVVDVRTKGEYDEGHIENSILIPNETIGKNPPEALPDKEATILLYCRSGNRSSQAARKLLDMGYQNVYDFGSVGNWSYGLVKEMSN